MVVIVLIEYVSIALRYNVHFVLYHYCFQGSILRIVNINK